MSDTVERAAARASRCVVLAALCLLSSSVPSAAQYVRGIVRDSSSNEPIEAFARQTCDSLGVHDRKSPDALSVFVLGRIALGDGTPASDVAFDARVVGNPLYDGIRQSGRADSDGLFQLCYLPPHSSLKIGTTLESRNVVQADTVKLPDGGFAFLRLTLDHAQRRAP